MGRRRGGLGDLCSRRGLVRRDAPPILFLVAPKRECAAPGGREKALRRVGLRQRRPPAAGGGWLALPCRSQGRKRTALGESLGPGRFRDTPASLSAAAHASAENQPARSDAERAKREAGQMRSCTPTTSAPSATGRQSQKLQKMIACPKAGQNRRLHRSADPRRAEARTRRSASKRSFLLDRARPVFFSTRGKRKWGVHPAGPAPCGSRSPRGRRTAARITLAPLVAASQQIVGSNAEVVRHFHQSRHIRIMPAALIILVLASTDFKNSSHLCLCLARLLAQLSDPLCKIFHAPPLDLQFNFVYILNTKLNYDFGDDSS